MDRERVRTWAEISLKNLAHNYKAIKASLPEGCGILGVVKANAYGHGAVEVSQRLLSLGCGYLAVATLSEGAQLRGAGIDAPVLVMGPTPPEFAKEAAGLGLTLTIGDILSARAISGNLAGAELKIHVKLDTGMRRFGFDVSASDTPDGLAELLSLPGLVPEGIFTHFAVSENPDDPFTRLQFDRFQTTVASLERASGRRFKIRHCANSGAVVNYGGSMSLDMVRPGISIYGLYPGDSRGGLDLLPVMTLKSRIASVAARRAGDTVSYGRTYTFSRDARAALLPVGYADGLHRLLSGKLEVAIGGVRANQLGRICMDMCMVDITHIPEAKTGDIAVIFGEGAASADELAVAAGTISYELLCSVSDRVPRLYLN